MNTEKNIIIKAMTWIMNTFEKTLVIVFDGIHVAVNHATPSMFALVATLLPFLLPLPVAFMTAHSAQHFFGWDPWASMCLGLGLEGLGLLVWVKLVDGMIARMNTKNDKVDDFVNFLWIIAITYEALLILINVVLAWSDGASLVYAMTLLLICTLPALSAAMYGLHRREVTAQLEREAQDNKDYAEKLRQERRADRAAAKVDKEELRRAFETNTQGVKLEDRHTANKFQR